MSEEEINSEQMRQEMEAMDAKEFQMTSDEIEAAKKTGFNPFWSTKEMDYKKPYKFRIVSEKMIVRDIEDKYADGNKTPRIIFSVEFLDDGMVYDIACQASPNKKGNFPSLTQAVRRLYALTGGRIKDQYISLIKTQYRHETYGDSDSFSINIVAPDAPVQ